MKANMGGTKILEPLNYAINSFMVKPVTRTKNPK